MENDVIYCNLVVIRSSDLDRAQDFYNAIGLHFVRHWHGSGPEHLTCELTNQVFEIYLLADAVPTISTRVGFCVSSVDDSYKSLLAAGGVSVAAPKDTQWGRRAVVADPDGHRIELTSK